MVYDFLAAEIPEQRVWTHTDRPGPAAGGDLPDGGWRQHRWWMDLVHFSQARLEYESRPQIGHADLRRPGGPDPIRGQSAKSMGGRGADRLGGRVAPGFLGQSVHAGV